MSNKVLKPKKASLYQFTQKYSNNIDNCIEFFKSMKWPEAFRVTVVAVISIT